MAEQSEEIDLAELCGWLREAGALALELRPGVHAEIKADRSPVTAADRAVETFLIERIRQRYPGHQILSEESGLHPGAAAAEFAWALDPIDGTRAFASGLPVWGVSAGVLHQGQPYAGGFYLPVTGELYWGSAQQAWYGQRPLERTSAARHGPENVLNFLAVPSNFHRHYEISAPRIRSLGSTAAHLSYVASGAALGMLTGQASLWDVAGVLPLALAAGVEFGYLSGRPFVAGDLLDGRQVRETLLAAPAGGLEALRAFVKPRRA